MDQLDAIIDAKKRKLVEARREAERLEIEVSALEQAAALRPAVTVETNLSIAKATLAAPAAVTAPKRGGRQPGSISHSWRLVLARWYNNGNVWRDHLSVHAEVVADMGLAPASVRERLRKFHEEGNLEKDGANYRVSGTAAARFKLIDLSKPENEKGPAAVTAEPSQLNGATGVSYLSRENTL